MAAAKKAVNELADQLKANVKKLLDGLGKLLKGALTLLEKAYTAAIDAVAKVVDTVIKAAKAFVDALVDFAVLIADIASDPVQWLRNLGAALVDGVKNHVWPALVSAVKGWFKSKVEEVVGVGKAILDVLRNGGITFGKIVTMAWTAIKESLPGILIQLLIEKLVAMLIPAAGALSVIIDGIKAAWAAASRILAAFQKFIAFLKAVKGGNAGPKFGDVVGAAAVAVMDFLANFVLSKLKGAGQKVGGTLRKMAERFMKAVKKGIGVLKRGAKAAAGAIRRGLAATGRALKRGATALGRTVGKSDAEEPGAARRSGGQLHRREGQGRRCEDEGPLPKRQGETLRQEEEAEGDQRTEDRAGDQSHSRDRLPPACRRRQPSAPLGDPQVAETPLGVEATATQAHRREYLLDRRCYQSTSQHRFRCVNDGNPLLRWPCPGWLGACGAAHAETGARVAYLTETRRAV